MRSVTGLRSERALGRSLVDGVRSVTGLRSERGLGRSLVDGVRSVTGLRSERGLVIGERCEVTAWWIVSLWAD